jgi:hypothetical protein
LRKEQPNSHTERDPHKRNFQIYSFFISLSFFLHGGQTGSLSGIGPGFKKTANLFEKAPAIQG